LNRLGKFVNRSLEILLLSELDPTLHMARATRRRRFPKTDVNGCKTEKRRGCDGSYLLVQDIHSPFGLTVERFMLVGEQINVSNA
jgi:hypothetical protein